MNDWCCSSLCQSLYRVTYEKILDRKTTKTKKYLHRYDHVPIEIGKGAFSIVFKVRKGSKYVAVKMVHDDNFSTKTQYIDNLVELVLLHELRHSCICCLNDFWATETKRSHRVNLYIEMPFYGEMTLFDLITKHKETVLSHSDIQWMSYQIIHATEYMHNHSVIHGDIKPQNIMVQRYANGCWYIHLCDFNNSSIGKCYNEIVTTRWYRAPEVLLMLGEALGGYGNHIDMWSIGCVLAEILSLSRVRSGILFPYPVLFAGKTAIVSETDASDVHDWMHDQLALIFSYIHVPKYNPFPQLASYEAANCIVNLLLKKGLRKSKYSLKYLLPVAPSEAHELITKLLTIDHEHRLTTSQALQHPFLSIPSVMKSQIRFENISPISVDFDCFTKDELNNLISPTLID